MELRTWHQCQRKSVECTGTLNLLPPSWDTVSALYSQVLKVVSKFPGHRRLVLYFAYKGATVKVDLGDVKAAGVVCILGLGIGLGTLFVYRLYHRYIRPFIDNLQTPDTDESVCSELSFLLDSSDSGVDGAKGSDSEKQLPALFTYVQYGVAFGGKGWSTSSKAQTVVDNTRLRRSGTRRRPVRRSRAERDSRHSENSSYLTPALQDVNFRDSFYSTAESGFETLPEGNEEGGEEEEGGGEGRSPRGAVSVCSGREKIERYLSSSSGDRTNSSPSGNKTVVDVGAVDNDGSSDVALTVLHNDHVTQTAKSSPARKPVRSPTVGLASATKPGSYPHSLDYDYDPSLDASESIQSFNSSGEDWSWEGEGKERGAPLLPPSDPAMTDHQFRQSLMQRVQEWAAFTEDVRARSPTPDCSTSAAMCVRQMRRSRSLDREISEPLFLPEVDVASPEQAEFSTIKNLECLETEFHDIQGEFESITSKLHDLIERGQAEDEAQDHPHPRPRPGTLPRHLRPPPHRNCRDRSRGRSRSPLGCRGRTRWERLPRTRSHSSSSRASSVEFSWDCGEVGGDCEGGDGGIPIPGAAGGPGQGDCDSDTTTSMQVGASSCSGHGNNAPSAGHNIGEAVPIEDYAAHEWKGETHKARTILQGYSAIPDLFHCQRLRRIRGDNYCALRSTLYQVLVGGHGVTAGWPGPVSLVDQVQALYSDPRSGLDRWLFPGHAPLNGGDRRRLDKIAFCVLYLYTTIEEISRLPSPEERVRRSHDVLNSGQSDRDLMEGLKLMMLFHACRLHRHMGEGGEVPSFATLLFARDTSSDPVSLVQNHLNCVGHSAGIDQVELCLLSHTLGVRVRVARLHRHGHPDFDCSFPDEAPPTWPCVCLLAEDDRHYNVPAP
ncbi:uncharacterized protein LOC143301624 [Babylonia areolata]|uniref:uncharacterized protein LOC143301624 n=1 Tax=Babylonia areolata TaxID=304850 RepID=UPI003FD40943